MKTEVVITDEHHADAGIIERAGRIIRAGGLVAFPTETVYGLGGDALNKSSSKKIYAAKGRPSDNPLIVHICDMKALDRIVTEIPDEARKLAKAFWPGPLTMIFKKTALVPPETTGGLDTVAVRMPANRTALALIEAAGGYIAAPSANLSGRPSPTMAKHVTEDMNGRIDMIIDGGDVGIGLESSIIDLTGEKPVILRPGYVTEAMMEEVLERSILTDKAILDPDSDVKPRAPGMKYRHYAPRAELTIVEGEAVYVTGKIKELTEKGHAQGKKIGIICTEETKAAYAAECILSVGRRSDGESIAKHLFAALREFDSQGVDCIYSESFPEDGLGQAIMNRLLKAAGHNILKEEKRYDSHRK